MIKTITSVSTIVLMASVITGNVNGCPNLVAQNFLVCNIRNVDEFQWTLKTTAVSSVIARCQKAGHCYNTMSQTFQECRPCGAAASLLWWTNGTYTSDIRCVEVNNGADGGDLKITNDQSACLVESPSGSNKAAIIGGCVAAAVVAALVCIIIVVVVACKRSNNKVQDINTIPPLSTEYPDADKTKQSG